MKFKNIIRKIESRLKISRNLYLEDVYEPIAQPANIGLMGYGNRLNEVKFSGESATIYKVKTWT